MITKNSISKWALLVVDVQDSFIPGARWQQRNNPAFEENINSLISGYREAKLPVFFFLDIDDDDEKFQTNSPYFKLMDFIQPEKNEPILIKTSRNCFTSTNLDELLKQKDI